MSNVIVILSEEKLLAAVIEITAEKTAQQTFEQWATRGAAEIGMTADEYSNGFTYEETSALRSVDELPLEDRGATFHDLIGDDEE